MRMWIHLFAALLLASVPAAARNEPAGVERQPASRRVVEIRSYNLKPGTRVHALATRRAGG